MSELEFFENPPDAVAKAVAMNRKLLGLPPQAPTPRALTREQVEDRIDEICDDCIAEEAPGYVQELKDTDAAQRLTITRLERELSAIRDTVGDTEFSLRQQVAHLQAENERLRTEKPYTETDVHQIVETHRAAYAKKIREMEATLAVVKG